MALGISDLPLAATSASASSSSMEPADSATRLTGGTVADEVRGDQDRCPALRPQRDGGRLPHLDPLRRVDERDAGRVSPAVLRDLTLDAWHVTDEEDLVGMARRVADRAAHDLARCMIAAHGVDGDAHRCSGRDGRSVLVRQRWPSAADCGSMLMTSRPL